MKDTQQEMSGEQQEFEQTSLVPFEMLRLLDNMQCTITEHAIPTFHPATDIANAARFRSIAVNRLLWVPEWETWMYYDGTRWVRDQDALDVTRIARHIPSVILLEASTQDNLEARAQLAKWAISTGRIERLKAAIHLGKSEPGLSASPTDFDAEVWIVGTLSGKLDLRTGQVSPCLPEDRVTRLIPITYEEDATCPRWELFLAEVFASDRDIIPYIQRVVGYCLTGSVREQLFWVMWGSGANGKSVFAEILRMILGDYYHRADPELFVTSNQGSRAGNATPQIAGLKGARLAIASETPPHGRLAETSLKELTGGDAITARFLFGNPFTFTPSHKLVLLTNHKPRVSQDKAVWRRMRLLPFNRSFPPESQDKQLLDKLKAELAGIFAWAVRGAIEWAKEGLKEPDCVRLATCEYQAAEDVVGKFIEECCQEDQAAVTRYSDLYRRFCNWSQENGEPEYGTHRFASELESRGFAPRKGAKGVRFRCGIRLRESNGGGNILGSAVVQ